MAAFQSAAVGWAKGAGRFFGRVLTIAVFADGSVLSRLVPAEDELDEGRATGSGRPGPIRVAHAEASRTTSATSQKASKADARRGLVRARSDRSTVCREVTAHTSIARWTGPSRATLETWRARQESNLRPTD